MLRLEHKFLPVHELTTFVETDPSSAVKWIEKNILMAHKKVAGQGDSFYSEPSSAPHEHIDEGERNGNAQARPYDHRKQRVVDVIVVTFVAAQPRFMAE